MTMREYILFRDGWEERERRKRIRSANLAVAIIAGTRQTKRPPNIKKIVELMIGDDEDEKDIGEFSDMIRESNARVAALQAAGKLPTKQSKSA